MIPFAVLPYFHGPIAKLINGIDVGEHVRSGTAGCGPVRWPSYRVPARRQRVVQEMPWRGGSRTSTATKWGISKIDALRGLFNGNPWMPTGIEPTG
jgi:hypothetical protein